MWIYQLNIGIKRIALLLFVLSATTAFVVPVAPGLALFLTGITSSVLGVLLWTIYRFGCVIRRKILVIGGQQFEIRDYYFPRSRQQNRRAFVHLESGGVHSSLFHARQDTWAYFDIVRDILSSRRKPGGKALMLGAGTCTVPYLMLRDGLATEVDAIEKYHEVVAVAKQYFLPTPTPKSLRLHTSDAFRYIQTASGPYDLIFVDLFVGSRFPPQLKRPFFAKTLKRILSQDGVVIINFGYTNADTKDALATITQSFPQLALYRWSGVLVGVSHPGKKPPKDAITII